MKDQTTFSEVREFILQQADNEPLAMSESSTNENCPTGCLLVQYGRKKLGILDHFGCGMRSIEIDVTHKEYWFDDETERFVDRFIGTELGAKTKTFGDLKKYL